MNIPSSKMVFAVTARRVSTIFAWLRGSEERERMGSGESPASRRGTF